MYIYNTKQPIISLCAKGATSALMKYFNCSFNPQIVLGQTSTAPKWPSAATHLQC